MGSTNPFGGEGSSINRPPIFGGEGYAYWKVRMRIFIEAIDPEIWEAIEDGPHVPMHMINEQIHVKPKTSWNNEDKRKVQYNLKAKNIITSALSYDEFFRVSQCTSAKDMWDTLQVTHEGTSEVKRARLNALCHEYELFHMLPNESIYDMQKRFTHIVNHLISLGKTFINGELANKVLRCMDRSWQPKVTAIMESKDLESMQLATLFGKLQEHEMELRRLNLHEDSETPKKTISLKASLSRFKNKEESDQDEDDESDSELDEESIDLLVRRFGKFLKKKRDKKSNSHSRSDDSIKNGRERVICHECGKSGHIRPSCPIYLKRIESEKKSRNHFKAKRAYIVWDTPKEQEHKEGSSSSDEEVANLCLMGTHDAEDSYSESSTTNKEVSIYDSNSNSNYTNPSYNELYNAFEEQHEELKSLVKIISDSKKQILQHEAKILELQKLVDELNLQNETLDLIYSNSLCSCELKNSLVENCEKCNVLIKENKNLKAHIVKLEGKNKLDIILSSQKSNVNHYGLGYKQKSFRKINGQNFHNKNSKFCCNYCGLAGHTNLTCRIKNYYVPSGKMIWCIKRIDPFINPKGPKTIWVPKRSN